MQRMSNEMKNMRGWLLLFFAAISLGVSAQTLTVKGNVKDTSGEPIIGASVVEKGNNSNGTITDLDGNFSIKLDGKKTLVISYIGMKTQEVPVQGRKSINVTMTDDAQALDEVVVIGYGTVNKRDLTGSVASVGSKELAIVPVSSATEALTGKIAGVNVTTTEGSPDAEINIRIRGGGSLSQDNSPLFIVDGFPVPSISDTPDVNEFTQSARDAYNSVLSFAGASLKRDVIDTRIINETRNGTFQYTGSNGATGGMIDSQQDVGGWPSYSLGSALRDTDGDGIPDEWETANGLNPRSAADGAKYILDRNYTNLEVYLNSLVEHLYPRK